jgi:hypothetical protein
MDKFTMFKVITPLLEREFSLGETMGVLTHNSSIYWSWGVSKKINFADKGLLMKVSGHHHKGWVLVTLGWEDLYKVHIISNKGEIKNTYEGIFFDCLTEIIDNRIERVKEYEF